MYICLRFTHALTTGDLPLDPLTPFLFRFTAPSILEDMVHLFQSFALRLWHKNRSPHKTEQAEDCEKDIGAVPSILDERWGDQANDELEFESAL